MRRYSVVFERAGRTCSAFVPDLPGCVATGRTRAEVERRIHEAIEQHLAGLRSARQAIPEPTAWTGAVEAS
ncbi:MAG: type II toxin-antitoxin system HicB family antitoxin [Chloroflexi bacterium]|nr:type II toxin-antitoxin system HicB family antitoxin [Chloroflexota bacterium]